MLSKMNNCSPVPRCEFPCTISVSTLGVIRVLNVPPSDGSEMTFHYCFNYLSLFMKIQNSLFQYLSMGILENKSVCEVQFRANLGLSGIVHLLRGCYRLNSVAPQIHMLKPSALFPILLCCASLNSKHLPGSL